MRVLFTSSGTSIVEKIFLTSSITELPTMSRKSWKKTYVKPIWTRGFESFEGPKPTFYLLFKHNLINTISFLIRKTSLSGRSSRNLKERTTKRGFIKLKEPIPNNFLDCHLIMHPFPFIIHDCFDGISLSSHQSGHMVEWGISVTKHHPVHPRLESL